ncbi:MAG TPA: LamG domain-containing protein [bacterium]|nr:LamG domain-containing protein [bacterium]
MNSTIYNSVEHGFYNGQQYNFLGVVEPRPVIVEVDTTIVAPCSRIENIHTDILIEFTYFLLQSIEFDILKLVPRKYHDSQILLDYLDAVSILMGNWLYLVVGIGYCGSPWLVPVEYLKNISANIGLDFPTDFESEAEARKFVGYAIDWYKMKGTYKGLEILCSNYGIRILIFDMYTNDYATFIKVEWSFQDEGVNPDSLSYDYYKSPHFTVEPIIDNIKFRLGLEYLWSSVEFAYLQKAVLETSPVYTVPHYSLLLPPTCKEDQVVFTTYGSIEAIVTDQWVQFFTYLDESWNLSESWNLDTFNQAFLDTVTKWKLGNGNKGATLYPQTGADPLISTPSASWLLYDDAANTTVADDEDGYTGVLLGGKNTEDLSTAGVISKCFDFDGASDYINFGNVLNSGLNNFSIGAWVKINGIGGVDPVFDKGDGYTEWVTFGVVTGQVLMSIKKSGNQCSARGTTVLNIGQWYFITTVVDRASTYPDLYVNGVKEVLSWTYGSLASLGNIDNASDLLMGKALTPSPTYWFDGYLSDVKFFMTDLPVSDILILYQAGLGLPPGGFSLENVVLSGTIDTRTVLEDRIELEFTVPVATVQSGLSELGLFLNDNTTLVAASLFKDVDKLADQALRVLFTIKKI